MKSSYFFKILILTVFISCKNSVKSDTNEKLCANELRLLNYKSSVANSNINLIDFRDNIKAKLDSIFFKYECKNLKVQVDFDYSEDQKIKLLLLTNNEFNCDYKDLPPFNPYKYWIHLYLTDDETIYVQQKVSDIDSVKSHVINRYNKLDYSEFKKVNIALLWDNSTDRTILNNLVRECIKAYLETTSKFSQRLFDKPICRLTDLQLEILHEKIPFNIRTDFLVESNKYDFIPHKMPPISSD
jgi:hypothetical protein